MNIQGFYDIAVFITGGNLPPQFEFINAIVTLVLSIGFIITVFAPFWFIYKLFD